MATSCKFQEEGIAQFNPSLSEQKQQGVVVIVFSINLQLLLQNELFLSLSNPSGLSSFGGIAATKNKKVNLYKIEFI